MSCLDFLPTDIKRLIFLYHDDQYLNYLFSVNMYLPIIDHELFRKLVFVKKYGDLFEWDIPTFQKHLITAVDEGNLIIVKFMVDSIDDLNFIKQANPHNSHCYSTGADYSLLYRAMLKNYTEMATFLSDHGANFLLREADDLLKTAIAELDEHKMHFLVQKGADMNLVINQYADTLTSLAIDNNNLALLHFLVAQGNLSYSIHLYHPISKVINKNNVEALEILIKKIHIIVNSELFISIVLAAVNKHKRENILKVFFDNINTTVLEELIKMAEDREAFAFSYYLRQHHPEKDRRLLKDEELAHLLWSRYSN